MFNEPVGQPDQRLLEPELVDPGPRRVRFTWQTQACRYGLLNLAILILLFAQWRVSVNLRELGELAAQGRMIQGRVTQLRESHGKSTSYYVCYEFQPISGGDFLEDRISVSHTEYRNTSVGDPISVTFLPARPEEHRVGVVNQARIENTRSNATMGLLIGGLVAAGILGGLEYYFRSRLALLRDGIGTVGQVVDHKVIRSKSTTYKLVYRYWLPDGDLIYGEATVPRTVFDRFADTAPLTVLYSPRYPRSGIPYATLTEAVVDWPA